MSRIFGVLAAWMLAGWVAGVTQAAPVGDADTEGRRERLIERYLEAGRTAEALVEAEGGAKAFPESGVIHRRLAQAHLCEALRLDRQLDVTAQNVTAEFMLQNQVADWRNPERAALRKMSNEQDELRHGPERRRTEAKRWSDLVLTEVNNARLSQFHERVRGGLAAAPALLSQRSRRLAESLADVREARRLGDTSSELELTGLWTRILVLSLGKEREETHLRVTHPGYAAFPGQAEVSDFSRQWESALTEAQRQLPAEEPDAVLRAAADLARRSGEDATALAGAADILSVVGGVWNRPDTLRAYAVAMRNHRFLLRAAQYSGRRNPEAVEAVRKTYQQLTDPAAKEPDAIAKPGDLAFFLYRKALAKDPGCRLPALRQVLYDLTVGLDRDAADRVLDELIRREPRNAAPLLERARTLYALDEKLPDGITQLRAALQAPQFSRSILAAMPAPLRPAFKFQRMVNQWARHATCQYSLMLGTLEEIQRSGQAADMQLEFRLLRLNLAEHLCQASDQADQADGIHEKARVLDELLSLKDGLTLEQKAVYERALRAHQLAFASYPKSTLTLRFGPEGLQYSGIPNLDPSGVSVGRPEFYVSGNGTAGAWMLR